MKIDSQPETRWVEDYDILSDSGLGIPLTVDASLGDSIKFTPDEIIVTLVPKPTSTNAKTLTQGRTLTITRSKILSIEHRRREVTTLTPEQQEQWDRTVQEMAGGSRPF